MLFRLIYLIEFYYLLRQVKAAGSREKKKADHMHSEHDYNFKNQLDLKKNNNKKAINDIVIKQIFLIYILYLI